MGKRYPATLEQLYEMLQHIRDEAYAVGFSKTHVSKIELAAEEALVNIIQHGYPSGTGNVEICCNKLDDAGLEITLVDEGVPFNPLEALKDFEPGKDLKEELSTSNQVGGYGIYFIVSMMDHVEYKRENECNILILKKLITEKV